MQASNLEANKAYLESLADGKSIAMVGGGNQKVLQALVDEFYETEPEIRFRPLNPDLDWSQVKVMIDAEAHITVKLEDVVLTPGVDYEIEGNCFVLGEEIRQSILENEETKQISIEYDTMQALKGMMWQRNEQSHKHRCARTDKNKASRKKIAKASKKKNRR